MGAKNARPEPDSSVSKKQHLESGLPRRFAPRNDMDVTIPSTPYGVTITTQLAHVLAARPTREMTLDCRTL